MRKNTQTKKKRIEKERINVSYPMSIREAQQLASEKLSFGYEVEFIYDYPKIELVVYDYVEVLE